MSLWVQILIGLVGGIGLGVFLGDLAAPLKVVADGYVKLLQMTVLPYVVVSIMTSLGGLSYAEARRLGMKAGTVLALLWVVGIGLAFLTPLAFPNVENATFFSAAMTEKHAPFDFLGLYIPSNPFHSLANNIVPAVVLFSVVLGVALIGVERKQPLMDALGIIGAALSRATRFIVRLTPVGIFAVGAYAAGTLSVEQIARIEVFLVTYVLIAVLAAVWIIPGLISALTPIRFGEVFGSTRDALLTAFMVGDLFVVLPSLTEECKAMLRRHKLTDEHSESLPDVIVPASFNFPHAGKLLSLSFILFAGWFADAPVRAADYPALAGTGLLTFFGSLNAAVPFLLDMFRIPADTFQLFVATSVINARFGTLLAAVHTVAIAILGSAAVAGAVRLSALRFARYLAITVVLLAVVLGGVRVFFTRSLGGAFKGAELVYGMKPLFPERPVLDRPKPDDKTELRAGVIGTIGRSGKLRVCVLDNRMPFSFLNREGELTGFDVEMARQLAHDLGVRVQFVTITLDTLGEALGRQDCELAMAGIPVTPLRMTLAEFSQPYLDETMGFVVRDHLRAEYTTWASIRSLGAVEIQIPNIPYYVGAIREKLPEAKLRLLDPATTEDPLTSKPDAVVLPAERGSVLTMLHPEYSVVVPEPEQIKVPLAYPVARRDQEWLNFVNNWVELKRKDGTIQKLYEHWILGKSAQRRESRWSVARNVLHWVR
ncbi:MAG: cation:dicarboxylase symporter family transporter [Bryobacteraceae bacterium]|nr:cation:dicarboxylase symporter family transporter [Bryobacteraceae bacterium]